MIMGVDLSVRTLYDQIWAYARFINEAPDLKAYVRLNPRGGGTSGRQQPFSAHEPTLVFSIGKRVHCGD